MKTASLTGALLLLVFAMTSPAWAWQVTFPTDGATSVVLDRDDNIIAAGGSGANYGRGPVVLKLAAADGAEIWQYWQQSTGIFSYAFDRVLLDQNGDLVLSSVGGGLQGRSGLDGSHLWDSGVFAGNAAIALDQEGNVFSVGVGMSVMKISAVSHQTEWVSAVPNGDGDSYTAVAVDSNGDVIVAGRTQQLAVHALAVAKFSGASGALLWQQERVGSAPARYGAEGAIAVAVDADRNVVVLGGLINCYVFAGLDCVTSQDMVAYKFAPDGTELWNTRLHGEDKKIPGLTCPNPPEDGFPYSAFPRSLAMAPDGSVVVGGWMQLRLNCVDYWAAKVALLDPAGEVMWQPPPFSFAPYPFEVHGRPGTEPAIIAMAVDSRNDIIVTGRLPLNLGETSSMFGAIKISHADGTPLWTTLLAQGVSSSIAVDSHDDVVIAGRAGPSPDGPFPFTVAKLRGTDGGDFLGVPEPITPGDVAAHWAPVIYQDTDSRHYEAEYIVAVNFDGDYVANNNWENLNRVRDEPGYAADLRGRVYYWVNETPENWYIGYAFFHPQDWGGDTIFTDIVCLDNPGAGGECHENDMEGTLLVIRKDTSVSPFGEFVMLGTKTHGDFRWYNDHDHLPSALVTGDALDGGDVDFDVGHPIVFSKPQTHAVVGEDDWAEDGFPGGDGIVYRYRLGAPEVPTSGEDADVGYELTSIEDLWNKRCDLDLFASYEAFRGDDEGAAENSANPPWGWTGFFERDGNTFFFHPANVLTDEFSQVNDSQLYISRTIPVPPADDTCPAVCGDGHINGVEECDDADQDDTNGCRNDCTCGPGWATRSIELIPAHQRPSAALGAMRGPRASALGFDVGHVRGKATSFPLKPYPPLGVYVHELFISFDKVNLLGEAAKGMVQNKLDNLIGGFLANLLTDVGFGVLPKVFYVHGDDRGHDPNFDPTRTRAFLVLDFEHGRGWIVMNYTTLIVEGDPLIGPNVPFVDVARTAVKPKFAWKGGLAAPYCKKSAWSWVWADWVDGGETFRTRYGLRLAMPGIPPLLMCATDTPLSLPDALMAAIDHQIKIDRSTGTVTFEGDTMPSVGTYRYKCSSHADVVLQQDAHEPGDLAVEREFSIDHVVNGSPNNGS